MASTITLADILGFVETALKAEGAEGDPGHARLLLRQCIAEAYRDTEGYDASWDNSASGALTLSGNACDLPHDCLRVTRVEWDGSDNPLDIVSEEYLDYKVPGWRGETGDPGRCVVTGRRIILESSPTGATTGKLVVRGYGCPDEGDVLALLPDDVQLSLAKYVLAHWPVNAERPASLFRYERYTKEWQAERDRFFAAIRDRSMRPFQFL